MSQELNEFFSNESTSQQLDELIPNALYDYVEAHSPIELSDAARLQEELVKIHQYVTLNHAQMEYLFLRVLEELTSCLVTSSAIKYWFSYYYRAAIESAGYDLQLVKGARSFFLAVLNKIPDALTEPLREYYDCNSLSVSQWILDIYLDAPSEWSFKIETTSGAEAQEERRRYIKMNAKDLLVQYGIKKPRQFLTKLNENFILKKYRMEVLVLLSIYVGQQPHFLYMIESTPLLDNLLMCLSRDFSSSTLSICCTVLAMVLPHVCNYTRDNIFKLLAIFGRLASWRVRSNESAPRLDISRRGERDQADQDDEDIEDDEEDYSDTWQVQGHLFDKDLVEAVEPTIDPLFIIIYGLFPANLMKFLRGPTKYLKNVDYDPIPSDFWDERDIVQFATARAGSFTLNPIFMQLTAKQELKNVVRFQDLGSATDVAAYCLQYYVPPFIPRIESENNDSGVADNENENRIVPIFGQLLRSGSDKKAAEIVRDLELAGTDDGVTEVQSSNESRSRTDSPRSYSGIRSSSLNAKLDSPAIQGIDTLLEQHQSLYSRKDATPQVKPSETLTSIPETLSLDADPASERPGRSLAASEKSDTNSPALSSVLSKRSSSDYSPRFKAVSSPGLAPQSDLAPAEATLVNATSPMIEPLSKVDSSSTSVTSSRRKSFTRRESSVGSASGAQNYPEAQQDSQYDDLNRQLLYFKRELMLIKNELEFVSYIEYHSQYRYKQLKEKMTRQVIHHERIEQLAIHNRSLKTSYQILKQEAEKARRSALLFRNERQAYEAVLVNKNKENRNKVKDLVSANEELQDQIKGFDESRQNLEKLIADKDQIISELELKLKFAAEGSEKAESYLKALQRVKGELNKVKPSDSVTTSGSESINTASFESTARKDAEVSSNTGTEEKGLNGASPVVESLSTENTLLQTRYNSMVLELADMKLSQTVMKNDMNQLESSYEIQIADLKATILEYEDKLARDKANPSEEVIRLVQSVKETTESQYWELKYAYDSLANKYSSLSAELQKRIEDQEKRLLTEEPMGKKVLSDSDDSLSSKLPSRAPTIRGMMVRQPTETRIRGRGGVQNTNNAPGLYVDKGKGRVRQNFRGMAI